jgi:hypothetical protein
MSEKAFQSHRDPTQPKGRDADCLGGKKGDDLYFQGAFELNLALWRGNAFPR